MDAELCGRTLLAVAHAVELDSVPDNSALGNASVLVQSQDKPLRVNAHEAAFRPKPVHQIPVAEVLGLGGLAKHLDDFSPSLVFEGVTSDKTVSYAKPNTILH